MEPSHKHTQIRSLIPCPLSAFLFSVINRARVGLGRSSTVVRIGSLLSSNNPPAGGAGGAAVGVRYLKHVEKQAPELGPLHHEERHLVAELGGRESKAAVGHGLLVDGADDLPQHLLGVGRVLGLLHEGGELGIHVAAVVPHAVQDLNQLVHLVLLRAGGLHGHFILGVRETNRVAPEWSAAFCGGVASGGGAATLRKDPPHLLEPEV